MVRINPRLYRPAEVDMLIGDAAKARNQPRVGSENVARGTVRDDGRGRSAPQCEWLLVLIEAEFSSQASRGSPACIWLRCCSSVAIR